LKKRKRGKEEKNQGKIRLIRKFSSLGTEKAGLQLLNQVKFRKDSAASV